MGTVKPNEIRIGNYIKIFNIVTQIEGYCIWDNVVQSSQFTERTLDEFEPEPLTEEWLLKFGFERKPWGLVKGELLFRDNIKNPCKELTLEVGNGFRVTVQYVHQLQNLYFELTGYELTTNEVN